MYYKVFQCWYWTQFHRLPKQLSGPSSPSSLCLTASSSSVSNLIQCAFESCCSFTSSWLTRLRSLENCFWYPPSQLCHQQPPTRGYRYCCWSRRSWQEWQSSPDERTIWWPRASSWVGRESHQSWWRGASFIFVSTVECILTLVIRNISSSKTLKSWLRSKSKLHGLYW